jgi:hypothetical protein
MGTDSDFAAVIERTDLWLKSAVDGEYQRLHDILADDFIYSGHPRFGAERLTKDELIQLASMLKDNGSRKYDQKLFRLGGTIISYTVTRSEEKIMGDLGDVAASSDAMNNAMNGKILAYCSSWRNEDGRWRCFGIHLLDAVDPAAAPEFA